MKAYNVELIGPYAFLKKRLIILSFHERNFSGNTFSIKAYVSQNYTFNIQLLLITDIGF